MVFHKSDLILNFDRILSDATDFIRGNPIISAVGLGTPLALGGIAVVGRRIASRKKRKATSKKRKKSTKRKTRRTTKKRRSGLTRATKQKIKFTKNGQPYVITRSGKARFIKRSVAKSARRRKGGFT